MKRKIIGLIVLSVAVVLLASFLYMVANSETSKQAFIDITFNSSGTAEVNKNWGTLSNEAKGEPVVNIVRTSSGYEPKEVTIKKGDIVLWTNESDEYHWPASDLHPTHGIYPEFDPLNAIASGQSWKFKFDKVGVWKFHDHIRANKVGAITVVE